MAKAKLNSTSSTVSDPPPSDGDSLGYAKTWLNNRLSDGATCPCCKQFAKLYHRPFNSGMAHSLIWLVRAFTETKHDGYIHVPSMCTRAVMRNREFDKLALHGVAETIQSEDPTVRSSGYWRPTALGIAVVKAGGTIHKSLDVYNGKIVSRSAAMIGIREALGQKFDYEELMHKSVADVLASA